MFERAIDLDPNYAQAHQWYSNMLQYAGRADEALTHAQRAVELEPYSAINRSNLGLALELQGRFQEAEVSYRRASTIDRSRPGPYRRVASLSAYARNRFTDAVPLVRRALEADPGGLVLVIDLANLYPIW
jgi:tetratricopeptide (TPR) repeat protein